ncbi:MAG TPA: bifunctional glutamine-synthetase adenylyltransferase/deadenyltransferase, partial [Propionibacteriaceae bacterium]|nr:bifunctional glutamine-synthetase adenylyltransferase/deadenyltransferase [Propionibacteriaceae bacterium]
MIRIETTQGTLARRGFVDAETAARVIDHWADEHEPLLDVLSQSADPDQALADLDRLCERVPDLLSRLSAAPILARQLIMVLGASNRLAQHLIAHPEHIELLQSELVKVPAAQLRRELLEATGAESESPLPIATETTGDRLRIAYRGALLRIAARDLCAPEPIEAVVDIADELSDLADATLEAALSISRLKLGEKALKTRLAVVGLGKCGAQELNYVSDVDVLFVAEPMLDADGTPLVSNDQAVQIATRMAAEMTRICSAHTSAGTIWEVDAALRPEGKAGQLVRTLSSHRIYYEKWAKTWEFQAMLKARPAAGDLELGQAFVDLVAPMVWRAAERENFVADTQAMRKRVVAHI